jgi:ribosomal protein S12 methylthiotransferase
MSTQAKISKRRLRQKIGRTMTVLVDKREGTHALARSAADAPEIDGTVRIAHASKVPEGTFARATITRATEHDLHARLAAR